MSDPDTGEDGVYNVFALPYARQMRRPMADGFMSTPMLPAGDPHDSNLPMFFYVWILKNRFRTVVVDTGFSPRAAAARRRPLDFDPVDALAHLGVDVDLVEDVIVTHLHYDHAGNIDRFGRARFHVQDAEAAFATGRCMCEPFMRAPFDVEDVVTLVRRLYEDRVVFHRGDAEPLPGISVHVLPGHSAGIQAVRVATPRGPVLLASDVSHYYANFLRRIPFRLTVDVAATLRSYGRLLELAGSLDRIIPGHDPKVQDLYPTIQVGGLEVIALHEPPKAHSAEDLLRAGPEPGAGPDPTRSGGTAIETTTKRMR